ncbi:MAG: tripartite tricarboxylate transporter TctB family protein [Propionivibrio sp.]
MRTSSPTLLSRLVMEVATALFTAVIGATVTIGSLEFGIGWGDAGPQPGYFPFYIGLIIVGASVVVLIQGVIRDHDRLQPFLTREQGGRIVSFFGPMLGFVVLAMLLGLYVALTLYLFGVMTLQGGYRPLKAAVISVGAALLFYVVFEIWFQVPLLKGPLERLLNIY